MAEVKTLVVGASGMLGRELMRLHPKASGTCFRNNTGNLIKLDLADFEQAKTMVSAIKPELIFLCAAETNVDECERNPDATHRINVWGAKGIADAAREANSRLVYISSDYVFDGKKDQPYTESDLLNPINNYGRQKLAAEHYILSRCNHPLIVRTSTLYGKSDKGFIHRLLRTVGNGAKLKVSGNVVTPTSARDLATVLFDTFRTPNHCWPSGGIINLCGNEPMKKVNYARKIAQTWELDDKLIEEVVEGSDDSPYSATRPVYSALQCDKNWSSRMDWTNGIVQMKKVWDEK